MQWVTSVSMITTRRKQSGHGEVILNSDLELDNYAN